MTRIAAYLGEAGRSLWLNKGRSVLTMLGMIIGTMSIIMVFGLSKAATSGIEGAFASFGTVPLFAFVDNSQTYPGRAQLRYEDAARVQSDLGSKALAVQPEWGRNWEVRFGKIKNTYQVATAGEYPKDDSLTLAAGRKLNQGDVDSGARVVVISQSVSDKFFPNHDAVGQSLKMNGARYTVVGVYNPIKSPFLTSLSGNDYLAIPYSAMSRVVNEPPDDLAIYAAPDVDLDSLKKEIQQSLEHIHGEGAQYIIFDGGSFMKGFANVLNIAGTGLAAIGTVALLVAGIGIMNIMLVTVTERTKEIGLRKSIGASRADVMLQFLMESIVLALLGGGTGMVLGVGLTAIGANVISQSLGAVVVPYVFVIALALGFSGAVGMLFGLYPAYRAATLDPIEALRT